MMGRSYSYESDFGHTPLESSRSVQHSSGAYGEGWRSLDDDDAELFAMEGTDHRALVNGSLVELDDISPEEPLPVSDGRERRPSVIGLLGRSASRGLETYALDEHAQPRVRPHLSARLGRYSVRAGMAAVGVALMNFGFGITYSGNAEFIDFHHPMHAFDMPVQIAESIWNTFF